jgi:histidine triad (HIT) family protein
MKNDCLFCAIVAGEIPGTKVYEDELCYAFRDINPQAPAHILVVPKAHIASVAELTEENAALAGHCLAACAKIAVQEGLTEGGYRIVSNCGDDAGQSVHHLHFHILGGAKLSNQMA